MIVDKVYVVMGNDFPEKVFAYRDDAVAFVAKKQEAQKEERYHRVHWRFYEFALDTGASLLDLEQFAFIE